MLKLYATPGSGSAAVEALLHLIGIPHEVIDLAKGPAGRGSDWYRKLNPRGEVPTLVLADGIAVTESAAIMIYLADRFSEAGLAPPVTASARAPYLRWMVYFAAAAYTSDLRMYYPERYSTDVSHAEGIKAKAIQDLNRDMDVFASGMGPGPFITGTHLSAADIYAAMLISWSEDLPALLNRLPGLARYYGDVLQNPVLRQVWQRNGLYVPG